MNKKRKYEFKPYDPFIVKRFEEERKRLSILLPAAKIHHIGSTAVPGLGGKGILDILIFVDKKKLSLVKSILEKKYELRPKACTKTRSFFRKRFVMGGKENRMHLHLTADKKERGGALRFRDALRNDNRLMKEYAKIKRNASKRADGDGALYREMKEDFIISATDR